MSRRIGAIPPPYRSRRPPAHERLPPRHLARQPP
jgi:hypothetical protein